MVASIGALTSAAQGVSYYERDGYYAKDDAGHRAASAWAGKGAAEAGLEGPVDAEAFHRPYKRLGVEKGDELRVAGVDRAARAVMLEGNDGQPVAWKPGQIGARSGGIEVYKREEMELRAGDRIRWTRNDTGLGLVNSQTAEVAAVRDGTVTFRLGDGRMLDLQQGDAQLRHVDRAWASTVHAFQGRTVDTVIAAMEANHPNLTTQKTLYVEIQPRAGQGRAGDGRQGGAQGAARSRYRRANRGAGSGGAGRRRRRARGRRRPDGVRSARAKDPHRRTGNGHRSRQWNSPRAPKSPDRDLGL